MLLVWINLSMLDNDGQPRIAQYREPHEFLLAIIVTWRYPEKPPKNNYEDIKLKSA